MYKVGDKVELNYKNKNVVFEIKVKNSKNEYKLYNKFELSFFATEDYITKNLITL